MPLYHCIIIVIIIMTKLAQKLFQLKNFKNYFPFFIFNRSILSHKLLFSNSRLTFSYKCVMHFIIILIGNKEERKGSKMNVFISLLDTYTYYVHTLY